MCTCVHRYDSVSELQAKTVRAQDHKTINNNNKQQITNNVPLTVNAFVAYG